MHRREEIITLTEMRMKKKNKKHKPRKMSNKQMPTNIRLMRSFHF